MEGVQFAAKVCRLRMEICGREVKSRRPMGLGVLWLTWDCDAFASSDVLKTKGGVAFPLVFYSTTASSPGAIDFF
jgi:hypothetical protein